MGIGLDVAADGARLRRRRRSSSPRSTALAALAAPTGRWRVIGRPAAHTLVEALRFSFPFGGVPLASLGISQVAGPLAGVARVGGVILITWVVLPARLRHRRRSSSGRRPASPLGRRRRRRCVVPLARRSSRRAARAPAIALDVAAVQGGGEQGTSALDVPTAPSSPPATSRRRATIEPDDVARPRAVAGERHRRRGLRRPASELAAVAAEAARLGVPFAVGVTEDVPGRPGRITNAQVVVTPDGEVTSRYDKVRRVPFGEYVPLRGLLEALGAPVDQVPTNAVAGTEPAVIDLPDGTRLGVVISWEVFFGGRAREAVEARRRGAAQPDERRQLHRHDRADPAGGVEPAAGDRDRALGRAGRADRASPRS